ncbi:MAG: transcription-repair coupling factor [Spirochaetales bacterium]|nr:transcription-repair coupling factor [Spirochaetales bacterium]MCF7939753.1 transcription-repair coupling factor [Spirochaetales bacterium]
MITLLRNNLAQLLQKYPPWKEYTRRIREKEWPVEIRGPKGGFRSFAAHKTAENTGKQLLIVLPTEQEARDVKQDLDLLRDDVVLFPWWGTVPYRELSEESPVFAYRAAALASLGAGHATIAVTSLRGMLTPVPPPEYLVDRILHFSVGDHIDPAAVASVLADSGYRRVPRVGERGEFALRGEVLDIFQSDGGSALRLVMDFDEIESMKWFDPITQASVARVDSAGIYPAREVVWKDERIDQLDSRLSHMKEFKAAARDEILSTLTDTGRFPGEELLFPLSFPEPALPADYMSGQILLYDYERMVNAESSLKQEYDNLYRQERRHRCVPAPERVLFSLEKSLEERELIYNTSLERIVPDTEPVTIQCDEGRSFFGNVNLLKEELENLGKTGYQVYIFSDSEAQAGRIETLLSEYAEEYGVKVLPESISAGFSLPDLKLMVIQENEIFGRRKRTYKSGGKARSETIDSFVDLEEGDFIVHVNYGIGKYSGIERITAAGNERDYIKLEYAGEEIVFIPIEQVNLIQKYIGQDGRSPKLDSIGGKSWEKRKQKVRHHVEDLADRLLKLYSKRRITGGTAYPDDSEWQIEFEAAFPYEETEDQLQCIQEVKEDMEQPQVMDRLVCGDVGYGKTEIAMRAAFKAVMAGKQAALLAPTTILAEQHYESFTERFEAYPVEIAMLSRFTPKAEQRRVLEKVREGTVDLVIGTHRLIQQDVAFKNLGLLVIDEEQRFGVKDKERLKELKTSVDCLTLTATPIPRTLHMSLIKIRDMSILRTPPQNRRPIETYIQEFNEDTLAGAVRHEMARGGQVFYLHNRVETLEATQKFLQNLVPEAMIATAHGQMHSRELEETMHRFIHGGYQVLVSTTIIENGIDIPNVNTIIVDRADRYGLSQLYQLRGRVGRSKRQAYAYLFYPADKPVGEIAMKRLRVLSEATELGAGFKVALKDMEIRGAGNLLGRQQHGDMLTVGFDMYVKLLDEAVSALEAEPDQEEKPPEVYLELDYTGFIPDSYIEEALEKMEVYKKIAAIETDEELERTYAEIEDRFGPLPEEVQSLLSLAEIRIMCRRLFISSLVERRGTARIEFARVAKVSLDKVMKLIEESGGRVRVDPKNPHILILDTGTVGLKEKSEYIRDRLSRLT